MNNIFGFLKRILVSSAMVGQVPFRLHSLYFGGRRQLQAKSAPSVLCVEVLGVPPKEARVGMSTGRVAAMIHSAPEHKTLQAEAAVARMVQEAKGKLKLAKYSLYIPPGRARGLGRILKLGAGEISQ